VVFTVFDGDLCAVAFEQSQIMKGFKEITPVWFGLIFQTVRCSSAVLSGGNGKEVDG
jgi:hypothetical protein